MNKTTTAILILIITFLITFSTSLLFELELIEKNIIRYLIVTTAIIIEFGVGFLMIKNLYK